jgi:hypothetical protein
MTKREDAIIIIDANRILFYVNKASNTLQLNLSSDVISNLEVVSREKLERAINRLFQLPSLRGKEFDVVVIFSHNITFEKELTSTNSKAEFEETQKFLDMVPFEEVLSNSYRINKKTRIVAANKILYNILKQVLERNKAHSSLVLPMTILAVTNPELNNRLDLGFIENKLESFKQYSILDLEEAGLGGEVTNSIGIKKKDIRLYLLVILMIILFSVLIFLIYTTFIAVPSKQKHLINNTPPATAVQDDEQTETPVSTDSAKIATPDSSLQIKTKNK